MADGRVGVCSFDIGMDSIDHYEQECANSTAYGTRGTTFVKEGTFAMNILQDITGPAAAFIAGLITSLHCVGMCGPLACALCMRNRDSGRILLISIYHSMRVISYAILGVVSGFIGQQIAGIFLGGTTRWIVWIFAVFFFVIAIGLDRRLKWPLPKAFSLPCLSLSPDMQAAALGLLTPLIPCTPLYLVILAASLSGSALSGLFVMLSFAIGTVPLVFILQSQYGYLSSRVSPYTVDILRRSLALVSIGLLIYRGLSGPANCLICH